MKTKLYYLGVVGLFAFVLWTIFFNSLPYNVNTIASDNRFFMTKITPEGWGFFTRSPREEMVDIYKKEGESWSKIDIKNNSVSSFFGLSRRSRKIGMEISIMLSNISHDSLWQHHKGIDEIEFPKNYISMTDELLYVVEAGEYALLKREIIPWSWRGLVKNEHIRYDIIGINCRPEENQQ